MHKRSRPRQSSDSNEPLIAFYAARRRGWGRTRIRGCIYARFSTRFQQSIEDQVRECKKWAAEHDIDVQDIHIFVDVAKTGKARRRKGLQDMLAALDRGEVQVVLTFATNRLNRRIHLALKFVEEVIVEKRRRCVFVAQNIDTMNTQFWKQLLYVFAMLDEFQTQTIVTHIKAAHIGLLLKKLIHSAMTFGYTGIVIPGEFTKQHKPRRRWEINEETREWVVKIFDWYLNQKMGYTAIARRLRKENAPKPIRAEFWTSDVVRYLLQNRRYIGDFSYGWREAIWQSGADYVRQFLKEKPSHEHLDESLRIIDDATFYKVQERIAKKLGFGGRPSHKGHRLPDILREVLWCPKHERRLSIFRNGLACAECKDECENNPHLYSAVNRVLGRKLLCEALARAIQADSAIIERVIEAARRQVAELQEPDTSKMDACKKDLARINSAIEFVLDNPGDNDADKIESTRKLSQLRGERGSVQAQIASSLAVQNRRKDLPDVDEIRALIANLDDILCKASASEDEETLGRVMAVIVALTGGKIVLSQQGEAKAKQGWLRGIVRVQLLGTVLEGTGFSPDDSSAQEIEIDFKDPGQAELLADEVKALYDQGLLVKEITQTLSKVHNHKFGRNSIAAALAHWFESRGLLVPDGRTRRATLDRKSIDPFLYQKISDQVMQLADEGLLYVEIAERLHVDHNTITSSVRFWHEKKGLPVPDGRSRRKLLDSKQRRDNTERA